MRFFLKRGTGDKRSFLSLVVACCMTGSLLSNAWTNPAEAKSARIAIVTEVKGDVTVKKSGGSKSYTVYEDMSLNQGDVLSTGDDSSAVIKIADHDDEITIGANNETSITDLADQGAGKISKFKTWAGSMWVKVKSLVSSEDEFEVETPTAVMGVRGTQYLIRVNPANGAAFAMVGAGKIRTTTTSASNTDNAQKQNSTLLLPAQQIDLITRDEVSDLAVKVSFIDVDDLVRNTPPKVLEAIIKSKADIDKENREFVEHQRQELQNNNSIGTGESSLAIRDLDTLNRVQKNLNNIVGNIALKALEQNKIDKTAMDALLAEANQKIEDPMYKLDLSKVEPLDPTAGVDPELEAMKQAELQKLQAAQAAQAAEQERQRAELLQRFQSLLNKVEQNNQQMEEQNKKILEAENRKAEETYKSNLSDEEKKQFDENKKQADDSTSGSTPQSGSGSSSGSGSGSSSSNNKNNRTLYPPVLVSPTADTVSTSGEIELKMTADANSLIQILNGDTVIANAQGNNTETVSIPLTLPNGQYNLTARALSGNAVSTTIRIPKITVQVPEVDNAPDILLTQEGKTGSTVNLKLAMKNFVQDKQFYAVEAHLVYDKSLNYTGPTELPDNPNTVFDGENTTAETLRQIPGTAHNELIYAASQFQPTGSSASAGNLTVDGEKTLVTVPLNIMAGAGDSVKVDLVYVKVVNKNGDTVAEFKNSKSIQAITR